MNNKKLKMLIIISAATLAFAGCGKEEQQKVDPIEIIDFSNIAQQVPDEEFTKQEEETQEVEPTTVVEVEEDIEGKYRSEITNEWIDEELQNQRPVAIMVDNEKTALEHYGVSQADVVYELMNSTANGRITRLMCIVKDWGKIEQFGSIRSTRPTNILLAAEWNAVLCHDGGPFYNDAYFANAYAEHFSAGFSRIKNGKPTEFTEYICTGELAQRFNKAGYSTEYNKYYTGPHYQFSNTEIDLSSEATVKDATEVKLPFSHTGSTLKYNEETKTYDHYLYGNDHFDEGNNNQIVTFKNVLIQKCTFHQYDDHGYMIYNCIDAGKDGYYLTNGKLIPIVWQKTSDTGITQYLNKATGEEIQINTGKTYVTLVPDDTWNDVVIK